MSNAWLSGLALHYGNFLKPLSYASHASHTSHLAISKARSPMPRPAECKLRSSVKWGCALRVVERRPFLYDSVVKDQFGSATGTPKGLGRIGGLAVISRCRQSHAPSSLKGRFLGVQSHSKVQSCSKNCISPLFYGAKKKIQLFLAAGKM